MFALSVYLAISLFDVAARVYVSVFLGYRTLKLKVSIEFHPRMFSDGRTAGEG